MTGYAFMGARLCQKVVRATGETLEASGIVDKFNEFINRDQKKDK